MTHFLKLEECIEERSCEQRCAADELCQLDPERKIPFNQYRPIPRKGDVPADGWTTRESGVCLNADPDSLIPIGGKIYEEARRGAGRAEDPILRARLLYDHIVNSLVYDKTGTGWGRGDALYACDARAGNCTDFHSLFIGEARALGLPSRFIMGLAIPDKASEGPIAGYHCWAEFYVEGRGWIPVDASEAHKDPSRIEELFGGLDADRVAFTIGRDIDIPGAAGGLRNYIIYPHVDVEGRTHADIETKFSFAEVGG